MINKKVIFIDLDGTILDVSKRIYKVYKDILKKYNKKILPKNKYLKLKRKKVPIETILKKTKAEDITIKFKEEWGKEIEKPNYLKLDRMSSSRKKILFNLKNNWKLVLVTLREHPKELFNQLSDKKIDKVFNEVLVSLEKDQKSKWKIKYELIKKYNKFDEASSIIIGDTETDILTGKNLGIKTIAVFGEGGMRNKLFLKKYEPDILIKDISYIKKISKKRK